MPSCSPQLELSAVCWEFEDELPEMTDAEFAAIFAASRVDVVRLYPFVEDSLGNRIWITSLPSAANVPDQATASEKPRIENQ